MVLLRRPCTHARTRAKMTSPHPPVFSAPANNPPPSEGYGSGWAILAEKPGHQRTRNISHNRQRGGADSSTSAENDLWSTRNARHPRFSTSRITTAVEPKRVTHIIATWVFAHAFNRAVVALVHERTSAHEQQRPDMKIITANKKSGFSTKRRRGHRRHTPLTK